MKTNWIPNGTEENPYFNWWRIADGFGIVEERGKDTEGTLFATVNIPATQFGLGFRRARRRKHIKAAKNDGANEDSANDPGKAIDLPLPAKAPNPCPEKVQKWEFDPCEFPNVSPNDIIVGIIDNDIALAHRRLRFLGGETRFLAAWQQGAQFRKEGVEGYDQSHLYFGRELSRTAIKRLLEKNSAKDAHGAPILTGPFNETQFNIDAGLIDPNKPSWEGSKGLELHSAHGAHVLDLAAGFTPDEAGEVNSEKTKVHVIAVSLPPQFFQGQGGNFLQFFAVNALRRIIEISDAISKYVYRCDNKRLPTFVNFSFGMQAGPKDGSMDMERGIRNLLLFEPPEDGDETAALDVAQDSEQLSDKCQNSRSKLVRRKNSRTSVIMPAGNSNLLRASARGQVTKDQPLELNVVVQPNDFTSNYIELWSDTIIDASGAQIDDLTLQICPPEGTPIEINLKDREKDEKSVRSAAPADTATDDDEDDETIDQEPNQYVDIIQDGKGVIGRVYYRLLGSNLRSQEQRRVNLLICISPTLLFRTMGTTPDRGSDQRQIVIAPAGSWQVQIQTCARPFHFTAHIQTDQTGLPNRQNSRRAYFDDELYRDYMDSGQIRDSFACHDPDTPLDSGPVSRVGSQNALATTPFVTMLGGYRVSDGCAVTYSSTGNIGFGEGFRAPDVDAVLPSETSIAHGGILASGSRDGTIASLSGTSMACALATRHAVNAQIQTPDLGLLNARWFQGEALAYKKQRPHYYPDIAPKKGGAGHLEGAHPRGPYMPSRRMP